jgi:hypothetical protein
MKMFRPALAGALSAFVLLVCIQLNARVKVAAPSQPRQLLFADRVAYQRAIEEVYWRHRTWPRNRGERPDPKPSLDAVMSQATIEKKVQDYLRHSELLEQEWQKPMTPEQLQAEMDRMAQHTKQPEVLRELFAALGNDPFVIAECLARPVLSERLQFAAVEWRKEPLKSESAKEPKQMPKVMAAASGNYTLPTISDGASGCIDDSWTATTTTNAPTAREAHTAVWTGSEMIVWGGAADVVTNTGGRYNPSTNSWIATSTVNAPEARYFHTAVLSGEMIVFGGAGIRGFLNTGGRYNPGMDSWTATTTINAPTERDFHTATWTGSEMIVFGGGGNTGFLNTGGRYSPGIDSWTATSTTNAPAARFQHTAVFWTGGEMIVWGGQGDAGALRTGGRYCAQADSPTPTPTPPPQITLSATGRKVNGVDTVRLTWSGATSSQVDIYRCVQHVNECNPAVIATTANDGRYIDSTGDTGRAGYQYRVCEAGTQTCSNTVSVTFQH